MVPLRGIDFYIKGLTKPKEIHPPRLSAVSKEDATKAPDSEEVLMLRPWAMLGHGGCLEALGVWGPLTYGSSGLGLDDLRV